MSERLFYVSVGGEPGRGPVGEQELRRDLESRKVPAEALICEVGSTTWRSIASLEAPDAPAPAGPLPPAPPPLPPSPSARGSSRAQRGGRPWFFAVLAMLGVAIAGGVVGVLVAFRRPKPQLCPGTPALLASLQQGLEIDAYITRGTPKLDAFDRDLEALLMEYKRHGNGRVTYRVIEAKGEDARRKAKDLGLVEQPFGEADDAGEVHLTQGFMGIAFAYGAEKDVIKFLPPDRTDGLAFWLDNKIRELRAKADGRSYRIGVLAGHGEMAPSEANLVPTAQGRYSIQGIITQNFSFYAMPDVDLVKDPGAIDPSLNGLVVTQPSSSVPEADLRRIDDFLMHGKAVAFFVGAANVKPSDATMTATLDTHGVERLLSGYGIELHRDVVIDPGAPVKLGVVTATTGGKVSLGCVPLATDDRAPGDLRLDSASPVFFRLPELAFPMASSLDVHREAQPEAAMRVLARSSPIAVRVTDASVDLSPLDTLRPKGAEGQVILAATVEGTLRSAFDPSRRSQGRARVLVVGSAQFLANPLARAGAGPELGPYEMMMPRVGGDEQLSMLAGPYAQTELTNTILAFKNTLDWLSSEDDLTGCLPAAPSK